MPFDGGSQQTFLQIKPINESLRTCLIRWSWCSWKNSYLVFNAEFQSPLVCRTVVYIKINI